MSLESDLAWIKFGLLSKLTTGGFDTSEVGTYSNLSRKTCSPLHIAVRLWSLSGDGLLLVLRGGIAQKWGWGWNSTETLSFGIKKRKHPMAVNFLLD
jgi:hypothetical protein